MREMREEGANGGGEEKDLCEVCDLAAQSPKIKKIFLAVLSLMEEGCDVNTIKVSDITTRAGIGKGTAYEYFKTKEEIIAKAIVYNMVTNMAVIRGKVEGMTQFRDRFWAILNWVEYNFNAHHMIMPFVDVCSGSASYSYAIRSELKLYVKSLRENMGILVEVVKSCKNADNLLPDRTDSVILSILLSNIAGFLFYMELGGQDISLERMKEVICENVERALFG